ncbi:MAG: hypothetical protein RR382_00295 [Tannerellaceae bacterium]
MNQCDYVTDQNPSILKYAASGADTPDYIIQANVITGEDLDQLSDVAFADNVNRLYPCHTKAATWLSAAYWAGSACPDDDVFQRIKSAAAVHGIEDDIYKVVDRFCNRVGQSVEKIASENNVPEVQQKFALALDGMDKEGKAVTHAVYPISDRAQIRESASYASADYDIGRLPVDTFRDVAINIVKEASAQELDISELPLTIREYGAERLPDYEAAETLILDRKPFVKDIEAYKDTLNKYASMNCDTPKEAIAIATKCANAILELDVANNVTYSGDVADPYRTILTGPTEHELEKEAADSVLISDVMVPRADFINIDKSLLTSRFTEKNASCVNDAINIVRTGVGTLAEAKKASSIIGELDGDVQKELLKCLLETNW